MNQGNLDDLIIGGNNTTAGSPKPRGRIVIIALIIIIIFVAILLIKSIIGGASTEEIDLNITNPDVTTETMGTKKEEVDGELEKIEDDVSLENSLTPTVSSKDDDEAKKDDTGKDDAEKDDAEKAKDSETDNDENESDEDVKPPVVKPTIKVSKTYDVEKKPEVVQKQETVEKKKDAEKNPTPSIKTQEIYQGSNTSDPVKNNKVNTNTQPKTTNSAPASEVSSSSPSGYYIQIGAFSKQPSKSYIDGISSNGFDCIVVNINGSYRVRVGPFQTEDMARSNLSAVHTKVTPDAFIVKN